MAVLLFRAKPVSGSTSRKWDTTCLALLPRMYRLASLSLRWDSCQIQSIASERSWRDVCRNSAWRSFLEQDYRGKQSYRIPLVVWDCFHITILLSSLDRCAQRNSEISSFLFWNIMLLLPRKSLSPNQTTSHNTNCPPSPLWTPGQWNNQPVPPPLPRVH